MRPVILSFLAACTAGLEPGSFDPPFENTRMTLDVATTTGDRSSVGLTVTGTRTVGGQELPVLELTDQLTGAPAGMELVAEIEGTSVTLGGVTLQEALSGLDVAIEASEPITVDMSAPIGVENTVTIDGTVTIGDPEIVDPGYLPFDVTYTVQSHDAVAPAPMGDIPGCRHTTFSAASGALSADGELWTRDDVGFVHAVIDAEPWGVLDGGASGYLGFGEGGGVGVVQAEQRLDAANPTFSMSTYDAEGQFDADKDTHAQMYFEMRWADADKARTSEKPPVEPSFGTVFGFYPHVLVESPAGYLHPNEADEGYTYWVALVDQAAKNEAVNGIAYRVGATYVGSGDPVLVGAFIRYHKIAVAE